MDLNRVTPHNRRDRTEKVAESATAFQMLFDKMYQTEAWPKPPRLGLILNLDFKFRFAVVSGSVDRYHRTYISTSRSLPWLFLLTRHAFSHTISDITGCLLEVACLWAQFLLLFLSSAPLISTNQPFEVNGAVSKA